VFVEEINGKYLLKIGDFGLSAKMNHDKDVKHSIVGTHAYCAPEVFTGNHGKEIDLFSLGALIYRFLTGRERYMHQEITLAYDKTIGEIMSEITRNYPNDWCKVVVALLAPKPDQRPSIDVVIKYLNDYQTKLSEKLKKVPIPLTNPMVQQNVEPIKVEVIKHDPVESNSIFKYDYELKILCEMGFGDIALNKLLLKKYSGDIVRSVGEILNAK
jgi:serine/threonine protein kinase